MSLAPLPPPARSSSMEEQFSNLSLNERSQSSSPVSSEPGAGSSLHAPPVPRSEPNGSSLHDTDMNALPRDLRKEGEGWFAVFNPNVNRVLDINLVHTFSHERCVDQVFASNASVTTILSALFVVCASPQTESILQLGVIEQFRSTKRTLGKKFGESCLLDDKKRSADSLPIVSWKTKMRAPLAIFTSEVSALVLMAGS